MNEKLSLTTNLVVKEAQFGSPWATQTGEGLSSIHILKEYVRLTKPRITLLIVISTAVGFCFGAENHFNIFTLCNALLGAGLMAAGSAALNQWYERDIDRKMSRTKNRPLAAGTIKPVRAFFFGVLLSVLGGVDLWLFTNAEAALLTLATSAGYLFVYTPLKRKSPMCTTVGAIPGAMPPLIGFAAASAHLTLEAWILFATLFLWQFPHFHAIAWMYRDDYRRGDIKMLAVVEPTGEALSRQIIVSLVLLIPVTLAPAFVHMAGWMYFYAAFLLGIVFLYFGIQMCRERTFVRARRLLLASVIYLPLLFALLVIGNLKFRI